jgi:hypothetical protein
MRRRYPLVCLILVAFIASGIWATKAINFDEADQVIETTSAGSAADVSTRDMALQSNLIVTGRCIDTASTWIENGRVLVTLATVAVDEVIKGTQASTVTVVLPGGTDANRRIPVAMTYAGAPTMAPQENVFLFLTSEERVAGGYSVMGFAEGKLSVIEDEAGEKLVSRDLTKVRGQRGPGVVRGNRQFVPLSEFKAKVLSYLGQ